MISILNYNGKILKYLLSHLDDFLNYLGIFVGLFISVGYFKSQNIYLLSVGIAIICASLTYLLLKRKDEMPFFIISRSVCLFSDIAFWICFSLSLIILHLSGCRPVYYFILISICATLIAFLIINTDSLNKSYLHIIKILALSLNMKYSIYLLFAGFSMPDSWEHAKMIEDLTEYGFTNVLWLKEQYFPIMHIDTSIVQILFSIDVKLAMNFAVILPMVISSICIFIFFRELFNLKVGLYSLLLVNFTDYTILWGSAPQTTSYGLMLFYFSSIVILKVINNSRNIMFYKLLLFVFTIALIFEHPVSSFIFITILCGLALAHFIYCHLWGAHYKNHLFSIAVFSVMSLLFYWSIALYISSPIFDTLVAMLKSAATEYMGFLNVPETTNEIISELPPILERLVDVLGFSLYIYLFVIAALYLLSPKYCNRIYFSLIFCTGLLLGITFIFPLFGLRNLIPDRWFAFEYFFISGLAAFVLIKFSSLIKHPILSKIFLCVSVIGIVFFMSTSTISNVDNPFWLKESTRSTSFTFQEYTAAQTISGKTNSIISDYDFHRVLDIYFGIQDSVYLSKEEVFNRENSLIIWRAYTLERPIRVSRVSKIDLVYDKARYTNEILGFEFLNTLNQNQKVYDNQNAMGFYLSGVMGVEWEDVGLHGGDESETDQD